MALISIIIPVYNVEKYIGRCLDSILNQTFQDFEIIAVDDCGSDSSIEIVKEYVSKDARVRLIQQEKNMGPMVARQVGYNQASGDYIFFCDSDDTLPKDSLQVLYNAAVESNADIVIGHIKTITDGSNSKLWRIEHLDYGTDKISVYKSLILGDVSHNLCAKLFRTKLIVNYDYKTIPKMRNGEDALFFYQIIENTTKIICIEDVVYEYIQHETSSTHIQISKENLDKIIMMKGFLYNRIFCGYGELRHIGGREMIVRLMNWWANYPYYETRRFVSNLKYSKLWHLFAFRSVINSFSLFELLTVYGKILIKGIANRLIWYVTNKKN